MKNRQKKSFRWGSAIGSVGAVVLLFVLFVVAVTWFRSESIVEEDGVSSIVDILKPDPISQSVIDGAIDTESRDATLYWKSTGERVGMASRGKKDDLYYIEIKLSLPEIDREVQYYQIWLLRRLPYDFFSLGEMMTDEEGNFTVEWEAPDDQDYSGYGHIIVTRHAYDGDSDPGTHLVEGVFGD